MNGLTYAPSTVEQGRRQDRPWRLVKRIALGLLILFAVPLIAGAAYQAIGANVARIYAAQHPDDVAGLVLVDPG